MKIQKENALFNDNPLFPFRISLQGVDDKKIFSSLHWHKYMEFIYVVNGEMNLNINGEDYVLRKNDIAFIGDNTVHSTNKNKNIDCQCYVVYFSKSLIDIMNTSAVENKYINAFLRKFGKEYHYEIIVNKIDSENFNRILDLMFKEYENKNDGYEMYIKGLLYALISTLKRCNVMEFENTIPREEHFEQVNRSIEYIQKHFQNSITLSEMANMCNLSYHYFSKIFKNVTGKNFKEYLDYVRITESEKLMIAGKHSISEIAEIVGISDQSCFYRIYKRVRGCSPMEFKTTIKNI